MYVAKKLIKEKKEMAYFAVRIETKVRQFFITSLTFLLKVVFGFLPCPIETFYLNSQMFCSNQKTEAESIYWLNNGFFSRKLNPRYWVSLFGKRRIGS